MHLPIKIRSFRYIILCICAGLCWSCDDEVGIDTGSAEPVLNIDAWINNKPETQHVYLTLSQDYFDNENLPPVASGAKVTVTDSEGRVFEFVEDTTSPLGA